MTRRYALLLLAALALGCRDHKDQSIMDPAPTPITITLGESIFAVAGRTPRLINTGVMADNATAMVDQPLQITVVVDSQALPLPPTLFVSIGQLAGVVTSVGAAPMTRYADLAHCRELAIKLVRDASDRGWTVTKRWPMELAMMQGHLAEPNRDRYVKSVATLRRGTVELEVYIEESNGSGLEERQPPARGNLFLVNTDCRDKNLEDELYKRVFARRKQMTGGTNSVPLSTWAPNAGH